MSTQVGKYHAMVDTLNNGNSFVKVATEKQLLFYREYEDSSQAETEYNKILEDLKAR